MNGGERNIITNNIEYLVAKTNNVETLLRSLKNRGIITNYVFEEIDSLSGKEEKLKSIYENVLTRGPAAFEHLISALYETNNDDMGKKLLLERYKTEEYLKIIVKKSETRLDREEEKRGIPAYRMGSNPKGYALIINIHDFCIEKNDDDFYDENLPNYKKGSRTRFGSYRDVANLYTLLTQLGYEVTLLYDLTKDRFLEEIRKFRDRPEHYKVDSCVVIVMSHGSEINQSYVLSTYDEKQIFCNAVWQMFTSHHCPSLHGKPKIFVFQICRGSEHDMGVRLHYGAESYTVTCTKGSEGSLSQQMEQVVSDVAPLCAATYEIRRIEPTVNDFIFIYPSAPGTTSKRSTIGGAWLIQKICSVFMDHAWNKDVATMIMMVQREIDDLCNKTYAQHGNFMEGTQTTWCEGSAKKIYFNPGLYDEDNAVRVNISHGGS